MPISVHVWSIDSILVAVGKQGAFAWAASLRTSSISKLATQLECAGLGSAAAPLLVPGARYKKRCGGGPQTSTLKLRCKFGNRRCPQAGRPGKSTLFSNCNKNGVNWSNMDWDRHGRGCRRAAQCFKRKKNRVLLSCYKQTQNLARGKLWLESPINVSHMVSQVYSLYCFLRFLYIEFLVINDVSCRKKEEMYTHMIDWLNINQSYI